MRQLVIKTLCDADWQTYRSIRLLSLQDSPDSFGSTYEREAEFSEEQWKARLSASAKVNRSLPLVAMLGSEAVGIASAVIYTEDPACAHIYQMWVSSGHRGRKIGRQLINRIASWAQAGGARSLQLQVTTTNLAAIGFYESVGFVSRGETEPLRQGSVLVVQAMSYKFQDR